MLNKILEISEENRYVSLYRGFIEIKHKSEVVGRVPIDDICVLILSAQSVTFSKNIINVLAERNCITVLCGKNYIPQSIVMPVANHYLYTKNIKNQIDCSLPFKKKIWQQLVIKKIQNQAFVLKDYGKEYRDLENIANTVKSGDSDNREAYAAKIYWKRLFGKDFVRDKNGDGINAQLNYGYAIMRAAMIRALCAGGLQTALGVNHNNNLNQFCLADDFFEIYRPIVDFAVYELWQNNETQMLPETKRKLVNVSKATVITEKGNTPAVQSMHYLCNSYIQAMESKKPELALPMWTGEFE